MRLPYRIPEKAVQKHVVQLLRAIGGEVWELGTTRSKQDHCMGTRQTRGVPDVIAFLPISRDSALRGREHPEAGASAKAADGLPSKVLIFVEVKAQGGRLRPEQIVFRSCSIAAGVYHLVGDLDAVIAWLIDNHYLRADQVAHYRRPA